MYNKHKMYKGGSNHQLTSAKIFRLVGLFAPFFLIFYGIFIQYDVIKAPHAINNLGLMIFSFWWIIIGCFNFLFPSKTKLCIILKLITVHLLSGSYLIFVSGISSPLIIGWLLLIMASYVYFSNVGIIFSILALATTVIFDIFLWHDASNTIVILDAIGLAAVVATSVVVTMIAHTQETTKKELEQSKAQESLQRDRVLTIINNMTDAVLSVDMDGIIRVYNAASLNLLDTNNSLNGQNIDDALPLFDQDGDQISLFKELKKSKTVTKRDDLDYVFSDDDKIRLEVTMSPIHSSFSRSKKSETHDGYIVIMRDVTKSKSLEEERDEFISVVSHELRTPITITEGTISNVQVMLEHKDVTNAMLKDAMKTAHDQIIFLAGMVNDLSTLSRAERGVADEAEDIDMQELAHNLHNKYADEAKAKKLHLNLDLSPKLGKVHVSRLYLEEIAQNFITNAIKYTKTGSVTLMIKQKDGFITFSVKDTGIGISKTDQTKIFEKFYRSEDYRTRETSGTGLGLYIAAKLAHKIGTKINMTSRLNFGSTFSFSLPEASNNPKTKKTKSQK